jgi:hypothetical protein
MPNLDDPIPAITQRVSAIEPVYTLKQAAAKFFPDGPLTAASLRNEIQKGRLQATMPAGKLLITERALVEMFERCRVQKSNPISNGKEHRRVRSSGSSETERIASARAAASALMTRRLSAR